MTEFAIITERLPTGEPRVRTTSPAPARAFLEQAELLDRQLGLEVRAMETSLISRGMLPKEVPAEGERLPRGDAELWHAVGVGLRKIVDKHRMAGARERRWLWEAIQNLHASPRIARALRGRTRNHFEYCYRLGGFPPKIAEQVQWSEWVYFFDSKTVREEPRVDEWLQRVVRNGEKITRQIFRRFSENLNKRIRNLDTSVLSPQELFSLYDQAWIAAKRELGSGPPPSDTTTATVVARRSSAATHTNR